MTLLSSLELTDLLEQARKLSPLARSHITVVAASKQQPIEVIKRLIQDGITHFGENRVQEASAKWLALQQAYPQVTLHLIGALQTNKLREAVALFDVIETLDRVELADGLAEECARSGKRIECMIQVNTGEEPQKSGIFPENMPLLLAHARNIGLPVTGLMCVPPLNKNPTPHFALLYKLANQHGLANLSMGMSGDWRSAIRMGATQIRLGTALFGSRKNHDSDCIT